MKQLLSYIFILLFCACTSNTENEISKLDKLSVFDTKLSKPEFGDWLYEHKEKGQTFDEFKKKYKNNFQSNIQSINIQPVGNFTSKQEENIQSLGHYLSSFFQVEVNILSKISDSIIPTRKRRIFSEEEQHLNANYFLDSLNISNPSNNSLTLYVTSNDIYPEGWNFVYGLASFSKRKCVVSLNRLVDSQDTAKYNLDLELLCKVSSHELGHVFQLRHCIHAKCLMNGVNDIYELDKATLLLCTECCKKLYWNIGFKNDIRFKQMNDFIQSNKFKKDSIKAQKIIETFK